MKLGIIGSALAGKTTLMALLAELDYATLVTAQSAGKVRIGIICVPDQRLDLLGAKIGPEKKLVFPTLEVRNTSALTLEPYSISNTSSYDKNRENLAVLRELDGIICVSKAYQIRILPEQGNSATTLDVIFKEIEDIKNELLLSDLEIIEKRTKKLTQQIQRPTSTLLQDKEELELLTRLHQLISTEGDFASFRQEVESQKSLHGYGFLCAKPLIILLNIAESHLEYLNEFNEIKKRYPYCLITCLKLEYELKQLSQEERNAFMQDYGLRQLMGAEIVKTCYQALGLISFFTIGKDELRAWSIRQGANTVTAAGKVHTDMARGFISAEVVSFQDWLTAGSLKTAKEHGKVRLEGKNYIVKDGDIINFKFNI